MVKTPLFKGACTAMATPFNEHGIDYERLKKNIELQYEAGISALLVCGTTGEHPSLTENEHNELVRFTVNQCQGRMKVIAGVGSNNTSLALRYTENARYSGADGILMVTPYYNKSSQKGLAEHFTYVADRVDIPMILYNVPSRTGISISAEVYEELSGHPNINGVKEASGDFSLIGSIKARCGDNLYIWSGNDDNTVPMMALGALGVISVASNIVPAVLSKLCTLCLDGNYQEATALYSKYAKLFSTLFIETNPIPIKTAMQFMELDSGQMRLPLTTMGENNAAVLRNSMRELGLLV